MLFFFAPNSRMQLRLPLGVVTVLALLAGATLCAQSTDPTPYTFSTLAGSAGNPGFVPDRGSYARFKEPSGMAVDGAGNVYVADRANHAIRKITGSGEATILAGTGMHGTADGNGATAQFHYPRGIAVDGTGNLYVADTENHTIRKITFNSSGWPEVGTLAGTAESPGSTDGTGGDARFESPAGVAVDGAGNLYVADTGNHTIRKITSGGAVTTLAGTAGAQGSADGAGSEALFYGPSAVAVDNAGTLYVADTGNCTIRKIVFTGDGTPVVSTLAGTAGSTGSTDGTGGAAQFLYPQAVAVDGAGNVYVADSVNHTIRKITSGGVVSTLAGLAGSVGSADGTGDTARFKNPIGVAGDSANNLYVGDTGNHTIRRGALAPPAFTSAPTASAAVDQSFNYTVTFSGALPGSYSATSLPDGLGFATPGVISGTPKAAGTFPITLSATNGAGTTAATLTLTVATASTYAPPYTFTTLAGTAGAYGAEDGTGSTARFLPPMGVAVDRAGSVYVADTGNHTIRKITSGGVVTTLAGMAGNSGSTDGTGSDARLNYPNGVAVDNAGNVYVADTFNSTIRKIASSGAVTTLAGLAGSVGTADGTGDTARFNNPTGVAVDGAGNIYVADMGNFTIRKITSGGEVTTLAGTPGSQGSADGTGNIARFFAPNGVAVDNAGNVYVADLGNSTVRKITSNGEVTTLAGTAGVTGSTDGTGSSARFNQPNGVAVDSAGNVYVADTGNSITRKITGAGVVTTLAGNASLIGWSDGTGSIAHFNLPSGVAVDSAGNVYVADTSNFTIRWGALAPPALTSATTASATVGQSCAIVVTFSGALPGNYGATGLPAGLSLDPATGVVSGTPSIAGTFPITLGATNGAGTGTATLTLTVSATGFALWQSDHFTASELVDPAVSGPNADPDGDGLPNLLEYALGLEPWGPGTTGLPTISLNAMNLVLTYTRPVSVTDVTYAVEVSTDLTTWTTVGVTHEFVSSSAGIETWRGLYPRGSLPRAFLRLTVTR